jgi:hypothetical protein
LTGLRAQDATDVMRGLAPYNSAIAAKLLYEKSPPHPYLRHKRLGAQHAAPHLGRISAQELGFAFDETSAAPIAIRKCL